MRILIVADEPDAALWDYYYPGRLSGYDMILSCGDLNAEYLSFLVTMGRCPLFYVQGNHDSSYAKTPPEGCDSIDDRLMVYKGLRILGLGGCHCYNKGPNQYTQLQMRRRVRKLRSAIRLAGGVDIVLTHAAPKGVGDQEDLPHRGFEAFLELLGRYRPRYLFHGHVHLQYGRSIRREQEYAGTQVINCCGKYTVEVEPVSGTTLKWYQKLYAALFVKNLVFFS